MENVKLRNVFLLFNIRVNICEFFSFMNVNKLFQIFESQHFQLPRHY